MSSTKIIAVIGATGNQGGSVVNTFLQEAGWQVRAITRNTESTKAQTLKSQGADVVQADLNDTQSLKAAFDGAHVIFSVTDTWGLYGDPANKDKPKPGQPLNVWATETETQQAKNVIDAAAQTQSLERFIFSSLSDAKKWSKGKYTHVYHFDSKAKAEYYGQEKYPELWAKTSIYQAGFYLSNLFPGGMMPPRIVDDVVKFSSGLSADTVIPIIVAEEDTGPIVKALVQESVPGRNVLGFRENVTLRKFLEDFIAASGRKAEYTEEGRDGEKLSFADDLQEEVVDNFKYINEFGYDGGDPSVIHPKDLENPPALQSITDYLKKRNWDEILEL